MYLKGVVVDDTANDGALDDCAGRNRHSKAAGGTEAGTVGEGGCGRLSRQCKTADLAKFTATKTSKGFGCP